MKTLLEFNLIFEDGTIEITRGYDYDEINSLYLNEIIRTSDGLKKCVRVIVTYTTREKQLEHRLAMIQDDISKLIDFIDEERMMERFEKPTKVTDSAWNLINNIDIASDLTTDESLCWELFTKK